jgi:CHAT domain-containing protein/tetratricopeptide (TPR) repeat protein
MNDDANMAGLTPPLLRLPLRWILCFALAAFAAAPSPVAAAQANAPIDSVSDTQRLEAQLAEATKLERASDDKAREAYHAVEIDAERLGLTRLQAQAILGQASVVDAVDPKLSKTLAERAEALFHRAGDEVGEARAWRQLGNAYDLLGDNTQSHDFIERARAVFERRGERRDLALTYVTLMYGADLSARRQLYPDALAAARAGGVDWAECSIHHSMGDKEFMGGELADAYRTLTKALACYENTDRAGSKGRVLVSLGRVERAHGQYERALNFYQRAYDLQQQAHDEPAAIQSLNAIGVAYGYMGRIEESRQAYEEALQRARVLKSERYIGFLIGNLAEAYTMSGRWEGAIDLLHEALATEKNSMVRAHRYFSLGNSFYALGRFDEALAASNQGVAQAEESGSVGILVNLLASRAEIQQRLNHLDASDADIARALSLIEDMRGKTVPQDFMKRGFSEHSQEVFRVAIEVKYQRGDVRGALEKAEQARARAFLDLLASRRAGSGPQVEGVVASNAVMPYLGAQPAAAMDLESTRNVTAPNATQMIATATRLRSTLLVYWVGPRNTIAWVVTPAGQIHATSIAIDPAKLADLARQTTSPLKDGAAALSLLGGSQLKPWRELYQILIKPIRQYLPTTPGSLVTIAPHGPLFQVSFAGLQDEDGRYLIESHRLHYTPSIGVLAYTARSPQQAAAEATEANGKALLVGDPSPAASDPGDEALADLPWARREVTEIGTVLGPEHARVMTERDATENHVRQEIEQADLLHFATHGVIRQNESMSSFLALAQPKMAAAPETALTMRGVSDLSGGKDISNTMPRPVKDFRNLTDGKLTADEVYGLRLHASLVVLSACSTALGPMSGDGVIGFTRAFLYAGARSVIATEWNVPDQTGYELMKRFYRYRRSSVNGDASEALRNAQISMLTALRKGTLRVGAPDSPPESQVALRENPLFWAGFILVGEP